MHVPCPAGSAAAAADVSIHPVAEIREATPFEAARVEQLEREAHVAGQRRLAAADDDGCREEVDPALPRHLPLAVLPQQTAELTAPLRVGECSTYRARVKLGRGNGSSKRLPLMGAKRAVPGQDAFPGFRRREIRPGVLSPPSDSHRLARRGARAFSSARRPRLKTGTFRATENLGLKLSRRAHFPPPKAPGDPR